MADPKKSIPDPPPIPGERDPATLTGSETGTMGSAFGAHNPPVRGAAMDDETVRDREIEGGGGE